MARREDDLIDKAKFTDKAAGIAITRNPGVTMLWFTREYEIFNDGTGKPLIVMGRPAGVEWYREGRIATRAEVLESIEEGIPALEAVAEQHGEMWDLGQKRQKFEERYLPK